MEKVRYKGFIIFVLSTLMIGLSAENLFAQRPSRGGSTAPRQSQSAPPSRPQRGSQVAPSRGYSPTRMQSAIRQSYGSYPQRIRGSRSAYPYNRQFYRHGYGYRPSYNYRSYGFYNRSYYGYYNYYRPFIGFRLNVLPYGYYPFYLGVNQYYYSGGLFYRQYNNNYQVVVPPVGAEVPNLPTEASLVNINGVDYYEYKGVYYTQGVNADGKSVYIVAGKNGVLKTSDGPIDTHQIGDIINQLPEGSREVFIKNDKYFVSPDEVYYEEVVDGSTISYRVIGKL
ncbi:hypothetical protein EZJ43_14035 [Pedobacter changchengzhani]|uniref:Uncharacterized protein n=1 Tax=Pedobacter changchengzhani TaxID=2529274 RepID=A0A4R5MIS3_9SPHI|nr:DUF6515 family protein [Pedobacter changchengzhani]TDG35412.1 hypothetical protein EZJ43_14035 [Pedobacter changchengzhani]